MDACWILPFLTQDPTLGEAKPIQDTPPAFWIMLAIIFGIVYFLILRPQAKQEQERKDMMETLKKNDRVVTNGGILGVVMNVKGEEVVVKVDDDKNIKLRFLKSSIASVLHDDLGADKKK